MTFANKGKALLVAAGVAVVAAVVAAIVIEPPEQARKKRLDDRRVQDLWQIESVVNEYWKRQQKLPPALNTLQSAGLKASIVDPETNLPYEYTPLSEQSYRICANFSFETGNARHRPWPVQAAEWSHTAGRHCFERTVRQRPG
jgi:hypothetical protein